MPRFARAGFRSVGLLMTLAAGCVSAGGPPSSVRYRPEDFLRVRDSAEAAAAERASEPRVRIITPTILGADRFVESAFRVNADAYVMVVAVDYDGRAHVVFPESPNASELARANTLYQLPKFFAGFGTERLALYPASRYGMFHPSLGQSSGLIFAVASDRPLQLQRLATDDGEWNDFAIERLLWNRSYNGAGHALGRVLTLTGQDFDTDYSGFTQGLRNPGYMFASFASPMCGAYARTASDWNDRPWFAASIAYVEIDGILYARLTRPYECRNGANYELVPLGPVVRPLPIPSDSTPPDSIDVAKPTRIAGAPYGGAPVQSGSGLLIERRRGIDSARVDRDGGSTRRPTIDRGLRFLPPDRVGEDGSFRRAQGESVQEEMARERQARRASEARERRAAPQSNPANERPRQSEPSRAEPAAIERTGSTPAPSSSGGGEASERTGKPVKE